MERRLYKELWKIRFEKMLSLETQSVTDYQSLLEECKKNYKNHAIQAHLEKLIVDEKKHERLVQELLEILRQQAD